MSRKFIFPGDILTVVYQTYHLGLNRGGGGGTAGGSLWISCRVGGGRGVKGEKVVDPGETLLARRHGVANIHFVSPTQIARWHAEKEHA